jgi:hypothetical protein
MKSIFRALATLRVASHRRRAKPPPGNIADLSRLDMKIYFRGGPIALAFLVSAGVARAENGAPGWDNSMSPTRTGQPQTRKQIRQLSPAQKEKIFTAIRKNRVHVQPPPSSILVVIGALVPSSTELYSLPEAAVAKVPAARSYEYTIVQDTLVLVDPVSRQVVATERQ